MDTHRLVLPGDLNQYGFLFGGRLLGWIDEACSIAASLEFPGCHFVTIAMDEVEFRHSVREGTILSIRSERVKTGTTSVRYRVSVFRGRDSGNDPIFTTCVTYVNVDSEGRKKAIA